ncbi:MAG: methyltransferase domain-containing protein [Chloroflexi bacterium]|nr:methyltransferase domain-containing protein [Chloroflexota bacterium]
MSTQPFNPSQYKAGQRQEWDSAATGWEKWWEIIEKGGQKVSDRMVDLADIRPSNHVLDIGTGIGEPAVTAAQRVGSQGRVVGTDLSSGMLAIAEKRASALGLRNLEWRQVDAEELDFPDNAFDAALCRWGLMFLPNLPGALGRVRRLLKPNARLVATVWSVPPKVPMLSLAMGVAQRMLQLPPPATVPGVFSLAAPGAVEQAFTKAGFRDTRVESVEMILEVPSAQGYVSLLRDVTPPLRAILAQQPAQRQEQVWQGIAQAAQQHAQPDGTLRMANETIIAVGRR